MSVQTTDTTLIPALVAQQAASAPTATAVVDGDRELSYAELDQRAGRLAHLLLEEGAGPETVVGVALDRGIDLVVALLAVWRTGAGFVTIDPSYPAARLQWLLNDTGAEVVLAEHHLTEAIEATGARVVVPSRLVTAIAVRPVTPGRRDRPGRPRLRDVHLRFDRSAEGRRGHPRRHREPGPLGRRRAGADGERPDPAEDPDHLRRHGVGVLRTSRQWRHRRPRARGLRERPQGPAGGSHPAAHHRPPGRSVRTASAGGRVRLGRNAGPCGSCPAPASRCTRSSRSGC